MIGERLGRYRIEARLGEGGMGVVYRARDEQLERDVALKVLPAGALAEDAVRKRFRQEALALSQLNHPHICTIYEVGEEGGQIYLAMEYVKGQPLNRLVPAEGLPVETALRYGSQIADALAHAHQTGILHRDLKGSNIIVTPEGRAKVLDFGLAKFTAAGGLDARTISGDLTQKGAIVGTIHYMAPEVLRGESADARSDVWSLGVVLHHAVSGALPFQGASGFDLSAAILREPPAALPPTAPPALRSVLQRCLAKDPPQRYQTASEVRAALDLIGELSSGSAVAAAPAPARGRPLLVAAAAAVVALLAVAAWLLRPPRPATPISHRLISVFPGSHSAATFSPDGNMIAFLSDASGTPQVWVKHLSQGDPIQITFGDVPATRPRWSPGSDQIVFGRVGQGIWSVPPLGGPPRRILEQGSNPDLSRDGSRLVFERGQEIWIARPDGSEPRRVDVSPPRFYMVDAEPALSPDGSQIAFFHPEAGPAGDIRVVPVEGGTSRRLTLGMIRPARTPVWTPDGRWILYSSARAGSQTLWRVAASGGTPEPITIGAGEDLEPALAADGKRVIYTNFRRTLKLQVRDQPSSAPRELLERRGGVSFPVFSPAGDRIAFFSAIDSGLHIFTIGVDGKDLRQVTTTTSSTFEANIMPAWSGDASYLYYYTMFPSRSFRKISAAGGASSEVAPWNFEKQLGARPHPTDGRIAYAHIEHRATVIWDPATGREQRIGPAMFGVRWSPDGRSISGAGLDGVIYVCPVTEEKCTPLSKGPPPTPTAWSADGSRVYFLRPASAPVMRELWSVNLATRAEAKVAELGPFTSLDIFFDVSAQERVVSTALHESRHELWLAELP